MKIFVSARRKFAYVWNDRLQPILKHARYPVPLTKGMGSVASSNCFRSTLRISWILFSTFVQSPPALAVSRIVPPPVASSRSVTHARLGVSFLASANPKLVRFSRNIGRNECVQVITVEAADERQRRDEMLRMKKRVTGKRLVS